jgi:para-aminobenzoate synthetase
MARTERPAAALPFDFHCGFAGYFGYELRGECGSPHARVSNDPDSLLLFTDRMIAFDHHERAVYLVFLGRDGEDPAARRWFREIEERLRSLEPLAPAPETAPGVVIGLRDGKPEYIDKIRRCLEYIRDGESYQVCLTNELRCRTDADPLEYYRILRKRSPAPHSAFLRFGELAIACSSPERFLRIDAESRAESKPMKGTCRRGTTPGEDARLRAELSSDLKNRSENLMIIDLVRNDLARVCEPASVHVPVSMAIETYATVHQMVSTVRGRLREGMTAVDCLRSCFPGGSMTGAPKLRTMEIIDKLEGRPRGIYSGCLGYLGLNGAADLGMVIRTAVFRPGEMSAGVGGAIVALSDPEDEFEETILKARAILAALGAAPALP